MKHHVISEIERLVMAKPKEKPKATGLGTGSTLLNLACSGRSSWGWQLGHYYHFVGDSNSGKTWLTLTSLAEAANNPKFDNHTLDYVNVERGAIMDWRKFFGRKMVDRTQVTDNVLTVEQMFRHLERLAAAPRPFVSIVDALDPLMTNDEIKKSRKDASAAAKGQEEKGDFGTQKAKKLRSKMREVFNFLDGGESMIIFISHATMNIGFGAMFDPKTHGGGTALKYYAGLQLWSSVRGQLTKKARGHNLQQGIISKVRVKKNRITGRDRSVEIPIYNSFGIDDVGSMVDYLIDWQHWETSNKGQVVAPELNYEGKIAGLIRKVEDDGLEKELQLLTAKVWKEIEAEVAVERKSRYE